MGSLARLVAGLLWAAAASELLLPADGGEQAAAAIQALRSLPVANDTWAPGRRLVASAGCQSCCTNGTCDQAWQGTSHGLCCTPAAGVDVSQIYCCPFGNGCGPNFNCPVSTHMGGVSRPEHKTTHASSGSAMAALVLPLLLLICVCCLVSQMCSNKGHHDDGMGGGMPMGGGMGAGVPMSGGMGGMPMGGGYGMPAGGGYGGGGYGAGTVGAAGLGGLLGGFMLSEAMSGGGFGGGGGYGGEMMDYGGSGGGGYMPADGSFGGGGGSMAADGGNDDL